MRCCLLFLLFLSCTNNNQPANDLALVRQGADTFSFSKDGLQQQLLVCSAKANDSLWKAMGSDELDHHNLSSGEAYLNMKFSRDSGCLFSELFFIANKDWIQQLQIEGVRNDTLLLKLDLVKKGVLEDPWFHQIRFRYTDSVHHINVIVFTSEE